MARHFKSYSQYHSDGSITHDVIPVKISGNYKTFSHTEYVSSRRSPEYQYKGGVGGVLVIVVAFLLVATLFQSLSGATPTLTFSGFLQYMSNVPVLSGDWMLELNDMRIVADWGLANFIRDFLNILATMLSSLVFLFAGVAQLILYICFLVGYLFGV